MNRKNFVWILLSTLISIVLMYYLLKSISLEQLVYSLNKISVLYLLTGFIFHVGAYYVRTLRFKESIEGKINTNLLFSIHTIHHLYNQLLPAGTGELTFPFLLKKYAKRSFNFGTALIMHVRVYDLIIFLCLFLVSLMFVKVNDNNIDINILIILTIVLLLILTFSFKIIEIIRDKWVIKLRGSNKVTSSLKKLITNYTDFTDRKKLFKMLYLSLFSNLLVIGMFWTLLNGLGLKISVFQTVFAATVFLPFYLLPVKGIGGFGTTEGGWTLGLILLGINREDAIIASLSLHTIMLLSSFVVSIYGFIFLMKNKNKHDE